MPSFSLQLTVQLGVGVLEFATCRFPHLELCLGGRFADCRGEYKSNGSNSVDLHVRL